MRPNDNPILPEPTLLPLAARAFPDPGERQNEKRSDRTWKMPDAMFVFDTETRTDATQRLMFGSYRFIVNGQCLEEGLFFADDVAEPEYGILEQYVSKHSADVRPDGVRELRLLTRKEFMGRLYQAAYRGRCVVVGFNLPFDLSRIAFDCTEARGRFAGGFSLGLWTYTDKKSRERANPHRPRICIKQIDSKRALKGFTARKEPDETDLIPEGSETGKPEAGYKFRGHFLDLRTLAFALTDRGHSLESVCEAFSIEHGKQKAAQHGKITQEYIDYNRRDVLATTELACKLLGEYEKHPISLQVTKAYSPASLGKAYLRAMGITPILERQPDFPKEYLGYAQSAFFGGRASAHIRKTPVPVVYTDFLSMYPTVNALMNLWRFVIAGEITVAEHCQAEIVEFLERLKPGDLFHPEIWKHLPAFVKLIPDGDILPARCKYGPETNSWQIGVNALHTNSGESPDALWNALPDVVASVLLTRKTPQIVDAFRLEPHGVQPDLKPARLRNAVQIDPRSQDFFKVVIEDRKRLSRRSDLSETECQRLDKTLKVLANAASYGIYAEMNRQERDKPVQVTCFGIDAEPFVCRVSHPDTPGEFCFPPLASLITAGARLMLALLEHSVTELGGTYAMEDTDSMAIVATQHGGLISCPGGPLSIADNQEAIRALSWAQVEGVARRFATLNPYEKDAVPGSILKIETDNFDPNMRKQREIHCLAISAKRYALFVANGERGPTLVKHSEHGLGHLLNPSDPESANRDWIAQAWLNIVRGALGVSRNRFDFENSPAVSRITVSSPFVMRAFQNLNRGKPYAEQMKPFNFILTCHVAPFGHPVGANPEEFHLIAPFERNPNRWPKMEWVDLYSGNPYRITTNGHHGYRQIARVKTCGDILLEYEFHPETKCADAQGNPSTKQTAGLLQRRHIRVDGIRYIGKESNSIEDVEAGLLHSEADVYTHYPDPRRDEWETKMRPALKKVSLNKLGKLSGMSRRTLIYARTGKHRPHQKRRESLASVLRKLNLI